MNMQQGNLFSKKHNSLLFKSKNISDLYIDKALKSIDCYKHLFINYMKSNLCEEYKLLSKYIYLISMKDFSFLDIDFYSTDYTTGVISKNNKIKELIYETSNIKISDGDLLNLVKYKNKKKKGLQLFIIYDKNGNAGYIYLIDLYHMVLPTDQFIKKGQIVKSNPKRLYSSMKRKVYGKTDLCYLRV